MRVYAVARAQRRDRRASMYTGVRRGTLLRAAISRSTNLAKRYAAGAEQSLRLPERKMAPYEKIKQAIVSGELRQGEPLVELALAAWCGVSRTPIREALSRLEQDGLAERAERGLIVRESRPEEILDLYEIRIVLESMAASVASERRTAHDLLTMRRWADDTKGGVSRDVEAIVNANRAFHHSVWRASHNQPLIGVLDRFQLQLGRYSGTTLAKPGRIEEAFEQHSAMVDAIEARDGERAAAIATQHFTDARDIRLELWTTE
jgi:DNA-binding GntR family transcriptional regulator